MYLALGWLGDCPRTVQIDKDHPLLKDCKQYTEEEIEAIMDDEELTLALRSCLRYNVARIAGKWESTIPFIEDMISEGMLAIVEYVARRHDTNSEYSVMKQATSAIINALEVYLNNNQSLASPGVTKQKELIKDGGDPIFLTAVTNDYISCDTAERDPDTYKRDMMEALEALDPMDELDVAILRKSSWGKNSAELARELEVGERLIRRRRDRLYQQFLELTE
jgi:hypothetical protein